MVPEGANLAKRILERAQGVVRNRSWIVTQGTVRGIHGDIIQARLPIASVGALVAIERPHCSPVHCVIVGAQDESVLLSPLDDSSGIIVGARVWVEKPWLTIPLLTGNRFGIIDALGRDCCQPSSDQEASLVSVSPRWSGGEDQAVTVALTQSTKQPDSVLGQSVPERRRFVTGIRCVDTLHPLIQGQRIAVIAPPGCGKSSLLLQLAAQSEYDVLVMALVGERRREIREFASRMREVSNGARQTIVVAEPSDASPMRRLIASQIAVATAEHCAEKGKHVLLIIDSLTRVARAMREVGLMRGEKIVRGGYTASVYTGLPRLLERAGPHGAGIITAFYSLLSHDERDVDPLKEEVVSLVDGHVVLSESLARRSIYPAIHPTQSLSRLAGKLGNARSQQARSAFLAGWERLERDRDAVLLGGRPDAELSRLLKAEPKMTAFIAQAQDVEISLTQSEEALQRLVRDLAEPV